MTDVPEGPAEASNPSAGRDGPARRRLRLAGRFDAQHRARRRRRDRRLPDPARDHRRRRRRRLHRRSSRRAPRRPTRATAPRPRRWRRASPRRRPRRRRRCRRARRRRDGRGRQRQRHRRLGGSDDDGRSRAPATRWATAGNTTAEQLATSVVYYVAGDAAAQAVATSVATDLGGVQIAEMPTPPPIDAGLGTSTVLVMVGTDTADKTLADLSPSAVAPPPSSARPPRPRLTSRVRAAGLAVTTYSTERLGGGVLDAPARLGEGAVARRSDRPARRRSTSAPAPSSAATSASASPTITTTGVPAARGQLADAADDLAVEALGVEVALAGDDHVGGAARGRRGRRARRRARTRSPAGHRARRARRRARRRRRRRRARTRRRRTDRGSARRAVRAGPQQLDLAGLAPFCGANTAAASTNRVRTSHATSNSTVRSRAGLRSASTAPSPPSVVADPPRPTMIRRAPWSSAGRSARRSRRSSAASGSLPSAPPARASPLALAISITAVRRSSRHAASTGRPSGPVTIVVRFGAAEHVEQPLAAVGHRHLVDVEAELPAGVPDRRARLGRRGRAAELVERGDHSHRALDRSGSAPES